FLARQNRQCRGTGDSAARAILEALPERSDAAALWAEEYELRLFAWAAHRVRPEFAETTWQAFWQTGIDGCPAKSVGEKLGLSIGAVYIAKSRVLAKLREQIKQVQDH